MSFRTQLSAIALASLLAPVAAGRAAAGEHPDLVDLDSTQCIICHEGLIEGRTSIHAPAEEDCTVCHEVSIGEEGTVVALLDSEPSLCLLCHDELEAAVGADLETPHYPVTESCLTCHDPHGGTEAPLLHSALPGLCSDCHDLADLATGHGGQLTGATSCSACHSPHGSDQAAMLLGAVSHSPFAEGSCEACHRAPFGERIRLRARGERLCEACHGDVTETDGGNRSVHAATRGERGRAGCLSCHDPHMSDHSALVHEGGNALCRSCHAEVVAAAMAETGHYPAADDCQTCHLAHASPETNLLTSDLRTLCADCHDPQDEDLILSHLGADLARLACTSCHSPHGAGHPGLLAENLHEPVLDGCDLCHEDGHDGLVADGGSELCLFCHDGVGELAAAAEVPHGALELGACTDCHNPHASPQKWLVKAPGGGPCADCHDEQAAGAGEVAHGVIDLVGCAACHEPHGGAREKLLRQTGAELCRSCHDRSRVRTAEGQATVELLGRFQIPAERAEAASRMVLSSDGTRDHPVANHPVTGEFQRPAHKRSDLRFEGRLECLTCHDPHKGRSAKLLRWEAATGSEACSACHASK